MMESEVSPEESFLREMARTSEVDEWRGTNQEFYKLYADWCRVYDIKAKSAVGFGRDITPFILKGWVGKWSGHGFYGKCIDFNKIRNSFDG